MRGRGLKHLWQIVDGLKPCVAPHAGAWIETDSMAVQYPRILSPPMRGRGLKQGDVHLRRRRYRVAPHAGAWIETEI